MLLKQKRIGIVNGCGYADGQKQCLYMTKEKNAPNISTYSLMISCVIYAMKKYDIEIVDISVIMEGFVM
jgi:hypothetical protein